MSLRRFGNTLVCHAINSGALDLGIGHICIGLRVHETRIGRVGIVNAFDDLLNKAEGELEKGCS